MELVALLVVWRAPHPLIHPTLQGTAPAPPAVAIVPCTLSYPDKFYAAVAYVSAPENQISHETRLLLYGLHKQATLGPCNVSCMACSRSKLA